MTDHLFVYGTLMRAAAAVPMGRDMRARLDAEADWIGPATIAGRLFDLGRYPILVLRPSASPTAEIVHGEVYRLRRPELLVTLDRYEGLPPGSLRGSEYERTRARVGLAEGETIETWVYACVGDAVEGQPIISGRWSARSD